VCMCVCMCVCVCVCVCVCARVCVRECTTHYLRKALCAPQIDLIRQPHRQRHIASFFTLAIWCEFLPHTHTHELYSKGYILLWKITLDPVILEAGRKFSFEIKKHENPIIGWNYLSTISCFYWIFAVSGYFQFRSGSFLLLPKTEGPKLFVHSCSTPHTSSIVTLHLTFKDTAHLRIQHI